MDLARPMHIQMPVSVSSSLMINFESTKNKLAKIASFFWPSQSHIKLYEKTGKILKFIDVDNIPFTFTQGAATI